jgi:hypothetical protein
MVGAAKSQLFAWLESIFTAERLDELPEVRRDRSAGSFLPWLMKSESLPMEETKSRGGSSFFSWLLASEELHGEEQSGPLAARTPFLRTLFSREQLPLDPIPDRAPGSSPRHLRPGVRR